MKPFALLGVLRGEKIYSRKMLARALSDLQAEGAVRCLGRGPDAQWERLER